MYHRQENDLPLGAQRRGNLHSSTMDQELVSVKREGYVATIYWPRSNTHMRIVSSGDQKQFEEEIARVIKQAKQEDHAEGQDEAEAQS